MPPSLGCRPMLGAVPQSRALSERLGRGDPCPYRLPHNDRLPHNAIAPATDSVIDHLVPLLRCWLCPDQRSSGSAAKGRDEARACATGVRNAAAQHHCFMDAFLGGGAGDLVGRAPLRLRRCQRFGGAGTQLFRDVVEHSGRFGPDSGVAGIHGHGGGNHATGVGDEVRNHGDPAFEQHRLCFGAARQVRAFDDDLGRQGAGEIGVDDVLQRRQDEDVGGDRQLFTGSKRLGLRVMGDETVAVLLTQR